MLIGIILIIVVLLLVKGTTNHIVNFANGYLVARGIVYLFQLCIQMLLFPFSKTFWFIVFAIATIATIFKM